MRVQLLTVDRLLEMVAGLDRNGFLEEYPGTFLMAMGILSAEVLRARTQGQTMAISFGAELKHDVTQDHPLAGCVFFLPRGEAEGAPTDLTVGRSAQCALTVPEASISELHCSLQAGDEGVTVIDLNSKNGTSVNMQRLSPGESTLLADEDILSLGRYSFQVMSPATLYSALKFLQTLNE